MVFTLSALMLVGLFSGTDDKPPTVAPASDGVEIVLYSDFQCPFCAQLAPVIRELQSKGVDDLTATIVFKNFPLAIHPNAQLAHQAAMAAKEQGKFWDMHDLLFANQQRLQRSDLFGYATRLDLNLDRFERDLDSDQTKQAIAADVAEGKQLRVEGTPTYTINGKLYSGTKSLKQLTDLIAGDRRRARALADIDERLLSRGPANAPVTLELFADLQSPVSRPALAVIDQVLKQYPDTIRLQFRNFPLAFHPQAALAHEAAMMAARHGRFWEFVTFVLAHQDSLREQDLVTYAGQLGLDPVNFADAIRDHRYAPRVEVDLQAGQARGVRGSPVILVNDKRIDGVPSLTALAGHVEAAVAASQPSHAAAK